MNKDMILSIDFGHGETSASLLTTDADSRCEDVGIFSINKPTVPSYVMKDKNGKILVGEQVINYLGLHNVDEEIVARISWKKRPSQMSEKEFELASNFMRMIYGKIVEQNAIAKSAVVWLALPSGWKTVRQNERSSIQEEISTNPEYIGFLKIAKNAGIDRVRILPESRAALIGIRIENPDLFMGDIINKGVVVVDAGSSTLDISYIKVDESGVINVRDDGFNLGASLIDEMLLDAALDKKSNDEQKIIRTTLDDDLSLRTYVTSHFRLLKEDYFASCGSVAAKVPVYFRSKNCMFCLGDGFSLSGDMDSTEHVWNKKRIELTVPLQYSKTGKTWKEHLRDCLMSVKNAWGIESLGIVAFVGGASKMPFVVNVAKMVFGENVNLYHCSANPSLAVSHGIAYAARAMMAAESFCVALDERFDQLIAKDGAYWREYIIPTLLSRIGRQICKTIVPSILQNLKDQINAAHGNVILNKILPSINITDIKDKIEDILKCESAIPVNEFFSVNQTVCDRIYVRDLDKQLFYDKVFGLWSDFCQSIAIKNVNPSDIIRDEHLTGRLYEELYEKIAKLTKTIASGIYPTISLIVRDTILGVLIVLVGFVLAVPLCMYSDAKDFYRKHFESESARKKREAREKIKADEAKVEEEKRQEKVFSTPLTERQEAKLCQELQSMAKAIEEETVWYEESSNNHVARIVNEIKQQLNAEEITNKFEEFFSKSADAKKEELHFITMAILD